MHNAGQRMGGWCGVSLVALMVVSSRMFCAAQEKSAPPHLESQIMVFFEQVVQEQWPVTLDLVNAPSESVQVEPGQCIRFGVVATGDGRDVLLKGSQFAFEFTLSGRTSVFAAEPAQAIKQIKPHGGDFVTQALGSAGIKNPVLSLASLAASRARWCAPMDVPNGTATVKGKATTADGKTVSLQSRSISVKTFETARKQPPFKDSEDVGNWIIQYYAAPDPAQLWPALRITAMDEARRSSSNTMMFFVSALKACKPAADELIGKLAGEERWVRLYSAAALKWAGYSTDSLMSGFTPEDKSFLGGLRQPDPFDMTPGQDIGARQDMLWSIFFATGNIAPVRAIASELAWSDDYLKFKETIDAGKKPEWNASTFRAAGYGAAGWSLGSLSHQDALVADYIDAIQAASDTPAAVKDQLKHLFDNPAFRTQESK